jgi:ribosomal protein S18 acetylase RimI-like enzyme
VKAVPFDKIHMERLRGALPIEPLVPLGMTSADLTLVRVTDPTYDLYWRLCDRVGRHLGWSSRRHVRDRQANERILLDPNTEMLDFVVAGTSVGYSVTQFTSPLRAEAQLNDFGFFPGNTGRGYGSYFLARLIVRLEEASSALNRIFLSTRSTNGAEVPVFYSRFGFRVTKVEHLDATEH